MWIVENANRVWKREVHKEVSRAADVLRKCRGLPNVRRLTDLAKKLYAFGRQRSAQMSGTFDEWMRGIGIGSVDGIVKTSGH